MNIAFPALLIFLIILPVFIFSHAFYKAENIPLNFGAGIVRDFIEVVRFSRRIREAAPDVLLPYTWFPNVLCGLVWRFTGARVCVWNQRDSGVSLDPSRAAHRPTPQRRDRPSHR